MTIVTWIRVHSYKATHFENRKSILHFIAFMVLHTYFLTRITSVINHCSCIEETEIREGSRFGSYKYVGIAIWLHDIMLGTKEEMGKGAFGEMYVYAIWGTEWRPRLITHAKFCVSRLRGFSVAAPRKVPFPILFRTNLTTVPFPITVCTCRLW